LDLSVREILDSDLEAVLKFSDQQIGKGYFSKSRMAELIQSSKKNNISTSLILEDIDNNEILGLRITLPPGQWRLSHPSQKVHPELWDAPFKETAYFQSLFVDSRLKGQGWGAKLSQMSADRLKEMGAKAIICHSWNESPFDSSRKYLRKFGFQSVIEVPMFWFHIDYTCNRCGKPCVCTATEMVKYL
jgi:ribosomal protein S18 acetylase RimI-like enzyme